MFQAHPFRAGNTFSDVINLHGLEVFNGNNHANNAYPRTVKLCRKHNLMQIAGSDFHYRQNAGNAGIYLPQEALTPDGFVEYYRTYTPELFIKNITLTT